jgi:dipeptidyl aminopeptidase/acylaminoacyl peptidase
MKKLLLLIVLAHSHFVFSQGKLDKLTVEKIMRDPKWIGASPSAPYWSRDGKFLFFNWNPDNKTSDSVYYITPGDLAPRKTDIETRRNTLPENLYTYNTRRTAYTYAKNGDIYFGDVKTNKERRITQTAEVESSPEFITDNSKIAYRRNQNIYAWDIVTGMTMQITNFQKGTASPKEPKKDSLNEQEKWLMRDQLEHFEVLKTRKQKKDSTDAAAKAFKEKELRGIYYEDKILSSVVVSPTGRFVTYRLTKPATGAKNTIVPNYVTETGFTQDISGRTKVGAPEGTSELYVFDTEKDTVLVVKTDSLPGIKDPADYAKDYPLADNSKKKTTARRVTIYGPFWNEKGTHGVVEIYSNDNKDRWIMLLDAATAKLTLLDRQRDEAWIGGPGITSFGSNNDKWIDDFTYWFQSEATGYSHLYTINVQTGTKKQLTSGNYEVQDARLSQNKKEFFITTNEIHPGEKQYYRLPVNGGKAQRITNLTGANQVTLSPDEKYLAILYSYSTKPWELYLQENKAGAKLQQVTFKAQSDEFKSYAWRDPEVITFTAADGAIVYARLFKPVNEHPSKPAVIFVHGAGYLQNAHRWWSSYFREYMFHNLLAEQGYTVMDIDYRGSAGYGRDWRTGIYRYMGDKDLSDQVDGAKYLVEKFGVDPRHIGIYGGSYGGFITLMAMFTKPGVFAAGAGLRSVTDWAHYNHGYTSNILNEPFTDSIAYKKSSPIYYAEGLQGHLLLCHGMVDVNVHFQDIVRLTQRLIELKKDNWELAVYPMEDHGFIEPSSWTDEYKRILKLFNNTLKQ